MGNISLQEHSSFPKTLHSVTQSNEAFPSRTLPGGNSMLSGTGGVRGMGLQYYRCAADKE